MKDRIVAPFHGTHRASEVREHTIASRAPATP
jgi:hypothetical protein